MSLYAELAAVAQELLAEFGAACTMTVTAPGGGTTVTTATAVRESLVRHAEPNSGVDIGDWKVLVTSSLSPVYGARFTFAGETQIIVHHEPIAPAGEVVAHYVWTRKG